MEEEKTRTDLLMDHLKDYVSTKVELTKLTVIDKSSKTLSVLVAYLILKQIGMLFLLFASVGLAFYLSESMGKAYYVGFFIVSLFYLVVGLIGLLMKNRWLQNPILNTMVKKMTARENGYERNN